jgi:uncharacterized protein
LAELDIGAVRRGGAAGAGGMNTLASAAMRLPRGRSAIEPALDSAVYEGVVQHRRRGSCAHVFRYRLAQLMLDLDELDAAFANHRLWSVGRRNLAEFRRSDYLGPAHRPLAQAVREHVARVTHSSPPGPIRLLTHLRYGGYVFNPVSFYYCYAADGVTLHSIVAEITNTPWRERHAYVLPVEMASVRGRRMIWTFEKTFHVSPFLPMDRRYVWMFSLPGDSLQVHMDVLQGAECEFEATLVMKRRPLDAASLRRVLWCYPLMCLQVISGIYWQALRLWLKGTPRYPHPGAWKPAHAEVHPDD